MNRVRIATVFIISLALSGQLLAQADTKDHPSDGKEQLVVPLSEPGKPFKLEVHLVTGSITVTGYDGKDIIIDAQTEGDRNRRSEERETSGGMKRISAGNGLDLTAEERNNEVNIHTESANRHTNLTIKIPQKDVTLRLGTVNGGNIIVSNVSGEMEVTNVNGAITCNNISGSVVANTVNGNVVVTFKTIDPKAPMAFSTLNGNVDVSFPADAKANVKLRSDRGEIYSDFDVEVDKSQPKVNRTNESGMYRLSIEDWVYGKIGGGGPEMLMKNMNGNIYIRKAK
jgi:hypothetical protein